MEKITRIKIILLTMFVLAGSVSGAEQKAINIAPADCLFYAQLSNMDLTLSQLDQYLAGILPPTTGTQMLLRMGWASLLGNPSLEGVNTSGTIAVFGNIGSSGQPTEDMLTIVLPVSDYKKMLSVSSTIEKEDANGISAIKNEGGLITQAGSFALIKPPEAYKELLELKKAVQASGFKSLASTLDSALVAQSSSAPIWTYLNMPEVQKQFGQQIAAGIEEIKKEALRTQTSPLAQTGNITEILNMYSEFIKGFMTQSKYVSLSITPSQNVLRITKSVAALPGTTMAELLSQADSGQPQKLLPYLQNGAMFNYSGIGCGKQNAQITKWFVDWFSSKTTPENAAKITALANEASAICGGSEAVSAWIDPNGKPPFAETVVAEISDKDKFNKVIDQAAELINGGIVNDFYKSLGVPLEVNMAIKRGVENYNGTSIDSASFSIKFADSNKPDAAMIKQILGDAGITYRWAVMNNLFVCAIGSNSETNLKKLIDQAKSGTAQVSTEMKEAMSILPGSDKAAFVATFNVVRYLDILPLLVPMIPKFNISSNSNIAIDGKIDNGTASIDIAVPKAHLTEIMQIVQMFIAQAAKIPVSGQPAITAPNN